MGLFNLIWFVFFGWINALLVIILSAIMAITIIGYPIAKSLFQFAKLSAFPFGKEVIREAELKGKDNVSSVRKIGGIIANIVWFPLGLLLTIVFFLLGIIMFLTIIGIPIGIVYVRMGKFILFPIGAKVVTKKQAFASAVVNEMEKRENLKSKKEKKSQSIEKIEEVETKKIEEVETKKIEEVETKKIDK
jgi:uncharacterized membrane protein YccF (DUF307 family)